MYLDKKSKDWFTTLLINNTSHTNLINCEIYFIIISEYSLLYKNLIKINQLSISMRLIRSSYAISFVSNDNIIQIEQLKIYFI